MSILSQIFKDSCPILISLVLAMLILTQLATIKISRWLWISAITFSYSLVILELFIVLIDNFSTGYLVCRKGSGADCGIYPLLYKSQIDLNIYWKVLTSMTLIFGWLISPIFDELLRIEGKVDFSVMKKIFISKYSYYLCLVFSYFIWIAGFFLITHQVKLNILAFGLLFTNSWSLLVVIPFISIGLVELPKYLWRRSNPKQYLTHLQLATPKLRKELVDAEMEFSENVVLFIDIVDQLDSNHECYNLANQIYNTSPEFKYRPPTLPTYQFNHPLTITSSYITSIYNKIISLKHTKSKLQIQWNNHLKASFLVEDIVDNLNNSDHRLTSSLKILTGDRMENFKLSISWWYNIYLTPILFKLLSILSFALGVVIVWSEVTLTVRNPTLSIIAIIFEQTSFNYNIQNRISLVILIYMLTATMFGLLSIKPFRQYSITINRQNDLHSLFWIGMHLVTIAPTIIYNYLNMAQLGEYGKHPIVLNHIYSIFIDSTAPLGKHFNYYLPISIGVFVILIAFKLHIKLFKLINLDLIETYSGLDSAKVDGKNILTSERSKREREFQSDENSSGNNFNQAPHIEFEIRNISPMNTGFNDESI